MIRRLHFFCYFPCFLAVAASNAPFDASDTTAALMRHSAAWDQVSVAVNQAAGSSTTSAIT